ncbi:hypothetical protein J5690_07665 [bacterium]|nr:hypothetical protein [bacterium]
MGIYINTGNENFKAALAEEIFVDKTTKVHECKIAFIRGAHSIKPGK